MKNKNLWQKNINEPILGPDYQWGSLRIRNLNKIQKKTRDEIISKDKPEDYEYVNCYCEPTNYVDVKLSEIDRYGLNCSNVLCLKCGLIRINPRWRDKRYEYFYKFQYRNLYNQIHKSKEQFFRETIESKRVRELNKRTLSVYSKLINKNDINITSAPRVVEIGAGGGWNLIGLPNDWKKIGYDLDKDYIEIGVNDYGIDMRYGFVEDAYVEIQSANIILLIHVLEHFLDPKRILEEISSLMKETALLIIQVPGLFNIHNSALNPMTYFQNAHTYTFARSTLKALCEHSGLKVLESDESCTVVCMKTDKFNPTKIYQYKNIGEIKNYLADCEFGYSNYLKIRSAPVIGKYFGWIYRKIYFKLIGKRYQR